MTPPNEAVASAHVARAYGDDLQAMTTLHNAVASMFGIDCHSVQRVATTSAAGRTRHFLRLASHLKLDTSPVYLLASKSGDGIDERRFARREPGGENVGETNDSV